MLVSLDFPTSRFKSRKNSHSFSPYQVTPISSKENNAKKIRKVQPSNSGTSNVWRLCPDRSVSFISSPKGQAEQCLSQRGIVSTCCQTSWTAGMRWSCWERVSDSTKWTTCATQHCCTEGSSPLPAGSYFCLALNEATTLRALWQYDNDCTWKTNSSKKV